MNMFPQNNAKYSWIRVNYKFVLLFFNINIIIPVAKSLYSLSYLPHMYKCMPKYINDRERYNMMTCM